MTNELWSICRDDHIFPHIRHSGNHGVTSHWEILCLLQERSCSAIFQITVPITSPTAIPGLKAATPPLAFFGLKMVVAGCANNVMDCCDMVAGVFRNWWLFHSTKNFWNNGENAQSSP